MLAGALVGVQVFRHLGPNGIAHVRYAVVYALFSLSLGAWGLALVPSYAAAKYDVATVMDVAVFGLMQLILMIFAALRVGLAVWSFVRIENGE